MKRRKTGKCEGKHHLSATTHKFGFRVSTVNTIMKDEAPIREHVEGTAMIKSMIPTRNVMVQ
jgi:hypothetical protein